MNTNTVIILGRQGESFHREHCKVWFIKIKTKIVSLFFNFDGYKSFLFFFLAETIATVQTFGRGSVSFKIIPISETSRTDIDVTEKVCRRGVKTDAQMIRSEYLTTQQTRSNPTQLSFHPATFSSTQSLVLPKRLRRIDNNNSTCRVLTCS